jgi:crotonobetainyl-CoA:carnitine CoA-transferase CaiB-like acyl-CoA transferase
MRADAPRPVLHGVTVLEVGARIGASVAGSLLAQLGAEVICVEGCGSDGFAQPKWCHREPLLAGKRSLLFGPGDEALLADWARRSDVLLLSCDVDALAYGRAPLPQLPQRPEGVIVCDVTAFGSSGPLRGMPATDAQVQALSGVMDATGVADGPPLPLPLPLIEHLAGIYAAAGVLAALRGGAVAPVEVALYDVAFSAMTSFLAPALIDPEREQASRVGNRHTMAAPWNVYPALDGWVLLCAGNDEQWSCIAGLLGIEAAHLARNADRVARVDEVDRLVQGWTASRLVEDCVRSLSELGLACGPVAPLQGFPREPNLAHRRMVRPALGPSGQRIFLPASPLRLARTPGAALLRVPAPDADRVAIDALLPHRARPAGQAQDLPLAGIRVVEVGHYTTAPVAARLLAALGAEVIKIEPPGGEAVRRWPPTRNGQGVFFTFQNADKRSLVLDLDTPEGLATLRRLLAGADVLVENLRPGALARKALAAAQLQDINPRLVYCAISGFGADSVYPGRGAFDTVIQAMSGMMAINRIGAVPLKTGPSLADVMGAATGLLAVLAALHERDASGLGQAIDLSMQDICAWALQTGWNDAPLHLPGTVVQRDGRWTFTAGPGAGLPVLSTPEVVHQPQTQARRLWAMASADGADHPVLACPFRVGTAPPPLPQPGPALGRDTASILKELA